jgi:hypothetical protein
LRGTIGLVSGTRSLWLVSLPVLLAGCLAAHLAAYRIAERDEHARQHLLAGSGHGYLEQLPLLAAAALVVVLAAALHHSLRGPAGARPSAALFAALPPLAFALQEHVERWLHARDFPVAAALEPTFLIGLALQLPFAFLAWALARAVLRAAEYFSPLSRAPRSPRWSASVRLPTALVLPRLRPVAAGATGRGPPRRI